MLYGLTPARVSLANSLSENQKKLSPAYPKLTNHNNIKMYIC